MRVPKGEPANFLTAEELRAKFDGLVAPYLARERAEELARALLDLEHTRDVGALLRLTRPEKRAAERRTALREA